VRILHLISSSGLFGAERVAIELSAVLREEYGCDPVVGVIRNSLNPHTEVAEEAEKRGVDSVVFECKGRFNLGLILKIREYIRKNNIDLVHCHGFKSNFYGLFASMNNVPAVTTNHNWLRRNWRLKAYCFLDSLWIRYFDGIVAVSGGIKDEMIRYRVPQSRISVIDNGLDLKRFAAPGEGGIRRELGLSPEIRIISAVGALKPEKGYTYLLKAARKVLDSEPSVRFLIVGNGPLKKELEDEAKGLSLLKNVIFLGFRSDVPEILAETDLFVLSSVTEGLPMVLLEAMSAGKPVVATRVGAVPRVVEDDKSGVLVGPADAAALGGAIAGLLKDPEKAGRLGATARSRAEKEFSSKVMGQKYLALYKSLSGKGREAASVPAKKQLL